MKASDRAINPLRFGKTFWVALIVGFTTGMGNGSVFGATMMCALGRGFFDKWGGWGDLAYEPQTFQGFLDWCMIIFGIAFVIIMLAALQRHGSLDKIE